MLLKLVSGNDLLEDQSASKVKEIPFAKPQVWSECKYCLIFMRTVSVLDMSDFWVSLRLV